MKKLLIYLSIILALFALLYYIDRESKKAANEKYLDEAEQLYSTSPGNLNEATRGQLSNPDYQNIILPDEFEQKLAAKEDFYTYFFSPTCTHCIATTPRLNDITDELGVELHQYNVLEYEQAWDEYITSTPTLIYFEDGVEKERVEGGYSGNNPTAESDAAAEARYRQFFENIKAGQ